LADGEAEIDPVPDAGAGGRPEPELERLSEIVASFNALFGNIPWQDEERIRQRVTEEVPAKVAEDSTYQTAMANNDRTNAKVAMVDALGKVMLDLVKDETQLFKEHSDNQDFKKWFEDAVFRATYRKSA
jgi:type I restriction enzyme R subunit